MPSINSLAIQDLNGNSPSLSLFIDIIELLSKNLVHGKHMNLILLKDRLHPLVTPDLSLVFWDLQVSLFDVFPDLLNDLWPRELYVVSH